MGLVFKEDGHLYESIDKTDNIDWVSVTTLIGMFKQPFDEKQAYKSVKNRKSKWFGMDPEDVKIVWKEENKRSTDIGSLYHNSQEAIIVNHDFIIKDGKRLQVFKPIIENGLKYSPDQKLKEGIYPEHLVYLKSAGLCGQSDKVDIIDGRVHISDYKTNKKIEAHGYKSWDGSVSMMMDPIGHLEDCHLNHYALQLSIYMYMIIKHNPKLKPGLIRIEHIIFEIESENQYGYPIVAMDEFDQPIVKDVVVYDLPYLYDEVISMVNWLHDNKDKVKTKKI